MTYTEAWHEENTRYLTAALAAVRRPLEQRARANTSALPSGDAAEPGQRARWFARNKNLRDSSAPLLLDDKTQAADQPTAAAPANLPPPALVAMRLRLGLTQFEQDILALCAATELDTSVAGLCARAQGDASRTQPTFALALSLFASPAWDALSPERPLRYWRLIEVGHGSGQPLTVSKLSIDEWVLNYLKGLAYPDDRLAPMLARLDVLPDAALPPSHQQIADAILQRLDGVPEGGKILVVQPARRRNLQTSSYAPTCPPLSASRSTVFRGASFPRRRPNSRPLRGCGGVRASCFRSRFISTFRAWRPKDHRTRRRPRSAGCFRKSAVSSSLTAENPGRRFRARQ